MKFLERLQDRGRVAGELLSFFAQNKWWWLTPLILILFILGGLIILAQTSAVAPFIYTLF